MIVSGTQEALDLAGRLILNPGDRCAWRSQDTRRGDGFRSAGSEDLSRARG